MSLTNISGPKERFSELLALTQLLLLREHKLTDKCMMEKTAFPTAKPGSLKISEASKKEMEKKKIEPVAPSIVPTQTFSTFSEPKAPVAIPVQPPVAVPNVMINEFKNSTAPPRPADKKKSIALEPLNSSSENHIDLSYMQFFKEHFPQHSLSNTIPSDQKARKTKDAWMIKHQILPVVILSFHEQNKSLAFLKNIAKAINLDLAPACVLSGTNLEQNQQWDEFFSTPILRLIIACDYELYLQPGLMKYYSQDKQSSKHLLKQTPLLLLSDLSLYLKKPELKLLLWNAIRAEFSK